MGCELTMDIYGLFTNLLNMGYELTMDIFGLFTN